MVSKHQTDLWGDLDGGDFDSLPAGFFDDDADDDSIQTLHDIMDLVNKPISEIIEKFDDIAHTGRAGTVRGVRFSSGEEALLWLFRRGIFLYSSLVQFGDGTWGVAIGSSERPIGEAEVEVDVPF